MNVPLFLHGVRELGDETGTKREKNPKILKKGGKSREHTVELTRAHSKLRQLRR